MLAVCKYFSVSLFPRLVNYISGNSLGVEGPILWKELSGYKKKGLSEMYFWKFFEVYSFPKAYRNLLLEKTCINLVFLPSKFSFTGEFLVNMHGSVLCF
jgi:hypothetical protein